MFPDSVLFLFVRHGHVADNSRRGGRRLIGRTDVPLSDLGRVEADQLAAYLKVEPPPDALYTSPLERAASTATAIAEALGIPATLAPGLEEIDCGELEGQVIDEVRDAYAAVWEANARQDNDHFRWPGGESYAEFRQRVVRTCETLGSRHRGGTVMVVTHSGVIAQVVGLIKGIPAARWEVNRPDNASVTRVRWWSPDHLALVSFDEKAVPA